MSIASSVELPHPTLSELQCLVQFFDGQSGAKSWTDSVDECDDFLRHHNITRYQRQDLPKLIAQLRRRVHALRDRQAADEVVVRDYEAAKEVLDSGRVTKPRKRKWELDNATVVAAFNSRRLIVFSHLNQEERAVSDAMDGMVNRGKAGVEERRRLAAEAKEEAKRAKEEERQRKKEEREKRKAEKAATKTQASEEKKERIESKRLQRTKATLAAEVAVLRQQELTLEDIRRRKRIEEKTEEALDLSIELMRLQLGRKRHMAEEEGKENEDPQRNGSGGYSIDMVDE